MQSEDRVIDLLRAYVKEEAPADLWQVVSSDIANVLRKVIAVSAEGQRAKLELHRLKQGLDSAGENFPLNSQMRTDTVTMVHDPDENVEGREPNVQPLAPQGVFLAPGRTATLHGVKNRPYLHWCKICNELARSNNADPPVCPRRECRSALWRKGRPGKGGQAKRRSV